MLLHHNNIFYLNACLNLAFVISLLLFARWTMRRKHLGENGFYSLFAWVLVAYSFIFMADIIFLTAVNFFLDRIDQWLETVRLVKLFTGLYLLYRLVRLAKFFKVKLRDLV